MGKSIEDFYEIEPYSLTAPEKRALLFERLNDLTKLHYKRCDSYRGIIDKVYGRSELFCFDENMRDGASGEVDSNAGSRSPESIPFIPVTLFKRMDLCSVPQDEVFKTMTSSGTTGQQVSKIYLNRETVKFQQKVLVEIVKSFTGSSRMPMIIMDCPSVIKDRAKFSARGAGILGFSMFGSKKIYAFDDDMNLDIDGIRAFLSEHKSETIFCFGFTFMIWEYFYKELKKIYEERLIDLSNAVLVHGGGWKKLINEAVSKDEFKKSLHDVCGIKVENVHDYYGMVEQTGCVYMECECGHLHASIYSDVITRRMKDFSVCDFGEEGVIEVVSALPESYPGHAILTEDVGVVLGEDDCPCGRKGKYFEIHGRMAKAEVRGCSDTFEKR